MKKILPALLLILFATTALGSSFFQKTGLVQQTTVTATAGGTTTLVATSNQVHVLTGVTTQNLRLPDATGLYNGWGYYISNEASGIVTVQDSAAATVATLKPGTWAHIYLSSNVGATGNWRARVGTQEASIDVTLLQNLSTDFLPQYLNTTRGNALYYRRIDYISQFQGFGFEPILTNSLGFLDDSFLSSNVALLPIDLSTDVTGVLPEANGGTGESSYTNGQLLIGNGTGLTKATLTAGAGISITNGAGSISIAAAGAGTGDVIGPASSTDNAITRFDGITGKLIQNSDAILDDSENLTGLNNVTMGGNLTVDTSTLVTFATSNRVGIGTATPDDTLDVVGGSALLPLPAATPNVATLANSQYTVSLDETNDTFEFLGKDSAGATVQRSLGASASAAGADTQVQYNNAGSFGADSTFTFNQTTNVLSVEEITATGNGGSGANSERFGTGATGTGTGQVVIGQNAGVGGGTNNDAIFIGRNVNPGGGSSTGGIAIGREAGINAGNGAIAIGQTASARDGGVSIGLGSQAFENSIAIGAGASANDSVTGRNMSFGAGTGISAGATKNLFFCGENGNIPSGSNQAVFGCVSSPYTQFYFGEGITSASPSPTTLQGTGGSGTDIAASTFTIASGKGTGNATPPTLVFNVATPNSVSGTSLQSLVERFRIGRTVEYPQEVVTPASPDAGYTRLYSKNDGNIYQLTPAGVETNLASAGGTPAGSTTEIQFNNAGAFGADSSFVWLATSNRVGILATPDANLDVNGTLAYRSTSVALGGNVTDLGTATTSLVRLTAIATTNILGLANGTNGKLITLMNDTGRNVTIANEHASASAASRIITGTGATLTIASDNNVLLQYDSSDSRWKTISANSLSGTPAFTPDTCVSITSTGQSTVTIPAGVTQIAGLVVGGGGGGGDARTALAGGGGGAGSSPVAFGPIPVVPGQIINTFVGAGGAKGAADAVGSTGQTSVFGPYVSRGGGGGCGNSACASSPIGNSGGAANTNAVTSFDYSSTSIASVLGSSGYFTGGATSFSTTGAQSQAAGGAGGGGAGVSAVSSSNTGAGGPGFVWRNPASNLDETYAGGGSGGTYNNWTIGAGGTGGGGVGANPQLPTASTAGTTGGGGGGGGDATYDASAGGPGLIRYCYDAP